MSDFVNCYRVRQKTFASFHQYLRYYHRSSTNVHSFMIWARVSFNRQAILITKHIMYHSHAGSYKWFTGFQKMALAIKTKYPEASWLLVFFPNVLNLSLNSFILHRKSTQNERIMLDLPCMDGPMDAKPVRAQSDTLSNHTQNVTLNRIGWKVSYDLHI